MLYVHVIYVMCLCSLVETTFGAVDQSCRFGSGCKYRCNCASRCDPQAGCQGACDPGWDGHRCQRQNVALNQPARQSTTSSEHGGEAKNAVDGITGHDYHKATCTHTEKEQTAPVYWEVTLRNSFYIFRFTIYNRNELGCRLNGFTLSVDYTECYKDNTTGNAGPGDLINGTCHRNQPLYGNNVTISQTVTKPPPLTLCEVLIYVCSVGWYGELCDHECATGDRCARCDTTGYKCDECVVGRWDEHCNRDCGHCWGNGGCHKHDGYCPSGDEHPQCEAGYEGDLCITNCTAGRYGADCVENCGFCAGGETVCSIVSGECPGLPRCLPGYTGVKCKTDCNETTWGADCIYTCGHCYDDIACNKTSGVCPSIEGNPRCSAGYMEDNCTVVCQYGTWGTDCANKCSANCVNSCKATNGTCIGGCKPGYQGEYCQTETQRTDIGAIVGGVIGALLLTAAVVMVIIFSRRGPMKRCREERKRFSDSVLFDQGPRDDGRHVENAGFQDDNRPADDQNPYQNIDLGSTSVPVDQVCEYVKEKIISGELESQYKKFLEGLQAKHDVADKPQNKLKSRYKALVAYDHSRVILTTLEGQTNTDYINACYIDGFNESKKYIASQGATGHTINDFMRMIWEQNVGKIVMLTNLFENAKEKCRQYWSDEEMKTFGFISVTTANEEVYADYTLRTFKLTNSQVNNSSRSVVQFHFTTWPDHGAPSDACGLLNFRNKVLNYVIPSGGPILVHCSAGVGRTGTFIALNNLIEQAREKNKVDFQACVRLLRGQRVNMVQTLEQYVFLHEALAEFIKFGHSFVSAGNIQSAFSELCGVNHLTGKTKMMEQFQDLKALAVTVDRSSLATARNSQNRGKNRSQNILAADSCRPFLSTPVTGGNDYINAVFLPSYKKKKAFIQTQTPLPITVVDFWRLVYEHEVRTIVMLDDVDKEDRNVGIYWPENKQTFGPFGVETTRVNDHGDFCQRTFELTYQNTEAPQTIKHYSCKFWQKLPSPNSVSLLLNTVLSVENWQTKGESDLILVHCRDGAKLSGLYCAASSVIQCLRADQQLNIPLTVQKLRLNRPEIITDETQLLFLYELALKYLERNMMQHSSFVTLAILQFTRFSYNLKGIDARVLPPCESEVIAHIRRTAFVFRMLIRSTFSNSRRRKMDGNWLRVPTPQSGLKATSYIPETMVQGEVHVINTDELEDGASDEIIIVQIKD